MSFLYDLDDIFDWMNERFDDDFVRSSNMKDFSAESYISVPHNMGFDKNGNCIYTLDLCGIDKDEISIEKESNGCISVNIKSKCEKDEIKYKTRNIKYEYDSDGLSNVAIIKMDDVYDTIPTVIYKNGLLELKFEKKIEEKAKKIEIKIN